MNEDDGETEIENPNSAVIWHYAENDFNQDGKIDLPERFHRTISTVAIKNDLLIAPDFIGLLHCLDAKTGKVHWLFDTYAHNWGSRLIVNDKIYLGDEDGDITVFELSKDPTKSFTDQPDRSHSLFFIRARTEIKMHNSVYSTPIVANNTLFISNRNHLFAIETEKE